MPELHTQKYLFFWAFFQIVKDMAMSWLPYFDRVILIKVSG